MDEKVICIAIEGNGARPSHRGGGWSQDGRMFTLNTIERHAVCYGISSFDSNAMKSSNPHSGIYEAKTSRTLDLNGGNPSCNQGGVVVVIKNDNFPVESFGHDERSTQFSRGGCCDTLTQSDYKQPIIVCYDARGNGRGGAYQHWQETTKTE